MTDTPTDALQPDRDAVALALNTARSALQDALTALTRARSIEPGSDDLADAVRATKNALLWTKAYGHDGRWKE